MTARMAKGVIEQCPAGLQGAGPTDPSPPALTLFSLSFQFLILCFLVQPTSYTDASILGLMELLCRAGLDVGLRLLPKTDLQQLLLLLLENIQEWPGKVHSLGLWGHPGPWSTLGGESITWTFFLKRPLLP